MYCSDIRREVSNIPAEETKGRIVAINSARQFVEKEYSMNILNERFGNLLQDLLSGLL